MPDRSAPRIAALATAGVLAASTLTIAVSAGPAAAAPANDDWANATDASGLAIPPYDPSLPGVSISGTTTGATRESGEPDTGGASALGTVWYRYTAPAGSRFGQLGYRVTDRSAFTVAAYVPYVQVADPVPYPDDGVATLTNMQRVLTTGYDQFGTLPGDSTGGFLPAVRVEPGATVWFQISANPNAAPPVDGAFIFELFAVADSAEQIGRAGSDISSCQDPFGCSTTFYGDTSAASSAPAGPASMWTTVTVAPGSPVALVGRSIDAGWRAATRPITVAVYEQPASIPWWQPISDASELGAPIAVTSGAIEPVDGADYGRPGVVVNQHVVRYDWTAGAGIYHIRVDGDPTFVALAVSSQPRVGPTATIIDPPDGAAYAVPSDVPPLAYTCTIGSAPISVELVVLDGAQAAPGTPLPTSSGTHTIRVVCEDTNGLIAEANATYGVAVQLVVPDQMLVVDEDSSLTADLLTAVTVPPGDSVVLASVGSPAHGTATAVGGAVTYTPAPNYAGPDQFTYTVTASSGATRTATVNVTVTPVNDPPVAVDDTLTVNVGQSVEIDFATLVGNDTDIDGGPLSVTAIGIVSPSIGGQLTTCGTTRPTCRTYVAPATGGVENVDYVVSDGAGGTATGRLRITVVQAALPDTLLVKLTCSDWSYTVGGPTTGLAVTPQPFGFTLISGRARLGAADVRIGVLAWRGAAAGIIQLSDPTSGVAATLYPRNATIAIGSTWVMTGVWWRPTGNNTVQRCSFQVNVTDGG